MPTINTIDDVSNIRSIAAAVTANAGAIAIQNIAGVLKQVDDQGTVTSLGGGLGSLTAPVVKSTAGVASAATSGVDYAPGNWYTARGAVLKALVPTLLATPFATDCESISVAVETATAANSGLAQSLNTENGGVFQEKSGVSASSLQVLRNKNAGSSPVATFVANAKTQVWGIARRWKFTTTPDAQTTMNILSCNASDAEMSIVIRGAIDTTHFSFWVNGGSPTTKASSQVISVALNTYIDLACCFDGTTWSLLVNDVVVDTMTDLTNFGVGAASTRSYCGNGTTAANQEMHTDLWAFYTARAI